MKISVIIPTYNPHAGRLHRTLRGLRAQSLAPQDWECLMVDNASAPALESRDWADDAPPNWRLIREPQPGLSHARRAGFLAARGDAIVLVDDDNVLAPNYLTEAVALLRAHPRVGAFGGRSQPEFEATPEPWVREFDGLLACRDLGAAPLISRGLRDGGSQRNQYPLFAPIGAGMVLRREAAEAWLKRSDGHALPDRQGGSLSSSGDNDIVLEAMQVGWEVGYFPNLTLTHLIPASRTTRDYLARLNRGIQRSWMQVLARHQANPWPAIARWTLPLRKAKAWVTYGAWKSPAHHVRWQGACGHFEGLAASV